MFFLIKQLKTSRLTRNYIADSLSCCRLFVDIKLGPRKIENAVMRSVLPNDTIFKTEGKLSTWICDYYFDDLCSFIVMIDPSMRKLTTYHNNAHFGRDTISFLNFLKEGRAGYKYLNQE